MLDQCERLALGINLRSMQGMAGNDLDVFGQVFFKGGYLDLLTRRLTSDNGALLSRCISVSVSVRMAGLHHEAYKVHIHSRFDGWPLLQRCTGLRRSSARRDGRHGKFAHCSTLASAVWRRWASQKNTRIAGKLMFQLIILFGFIAGVYSARTNGSA